MRKVVSDRRASLNPDTDVTPAVRRVVEEEFRRGATSPLIPFPEDGSAVQDSPRLTLVCVADSAAYLPAPCESSS
jgi:hypothetical protein